MYLSAERMAVANRAVEQTFEQTSVAWQAIPHWDTGDPGQAWVRNYVTHPTSSAPLGANSLELQTEAVRFYVTLAQASAPTPDALLAAVMSRAVELAQKVDGTVLGQLREPAEEVTPGKDNYPSRALLNGLIDARARVEDAGYRAPSCLIASTEGFKALNELVGFEAINEAVLAAAQINSLHRATQLNTQLDENENNEEPEKQRPVLEKQMLLLGRRQRIAHGCAAAASPGEEPVDLAVSVPPSLEVVGETATGTIELAVRIRFATRTKDGRGVVAVDVPL